MQSNSVLNWCEIKQSAAQLQLFKYQKKSGGVPPWISGQADFIPCTSSAATFQLELSQTIDGGVLMI